MIIVHTVSGQAIKLTECAAGDFRSMITMQKAMVGSLFDTLIMALEKQSMRSEVKNIVLVESMELDEVETASIQYHMGFNLPVEYAADVKGAEFELGTVYPITGRLERLLHSVRFRRVILIRPEQINAMSIEGNRFPETMAMMLQEKMREFKTDYPHTMLTTGVKFG